MTALLAVVERGLVLVLLALVAPAAAQTPLDYVASEASPSGGYVEALSGAGLDAMWWPDADGPLGSWKLPAAPTARDLFAIAASGYGSAWPIAAADATDTPGRDLLQEARAMAPRAAGTHGIGDDAFVLLALTHWGASDEALVASLRAAQQEEGGWTCFGDASVDCTGFALAALHSAGAQPSDPAAAQAFIEAHITPQGGVRSDDTTLTTPNVNSAAWALHGLAALGVERPDIITWIQSRQTPSGGIAYADPAAGPDLRATFEALPVLAGHTLPWPTTIQVPVDVIPMDDVYRLRIEGVVAATWRVGDGILEGTDVLVSVDAPARVYVHGTNGIAQMRGYVDLAGPAGSEETPGIGLVVLLGLLLGAGAAGRRR